MTEYCRRMVTLLTSAVGSYYCRFYYFCHCFFLSHLSHSTSLSSVLSLILAVKHHAPLCIFSTVKR
jgi:hypothetical protein